MHALSLTIIASSSTAYELRQQQLESRLERIEMSLDRSLQASGGAPGVTQDEFTFASNPDPPIATSTQTVPLGSTSGEDKVAFPPVSNHIMSAVRSALGSSGVLATDNRTQDNDATGLGTVSRLVSEFYEECFPLYPAVDIASVQSHVNLLFSPAQWSLDTGTESLSVDDLDMLKAITAIAMQFSDDLQSPLKYNLLKYLNWNTNLCVIYFFRRNELMKAMRFVGFASRGCFELGLHKKGTYEAMDPERARFLKTIFCSVCVLEHRVAFGTQMPCLMRYCEIDDTALDITASHPFLSALLAYDRLSSEIDQRAQSTSSESRWKEESNYLSYKIQAFEDSFASQLKSDDWVPEVALAPSQRVILNFQALLRLRINHLKIRLYCRQKKADSSGSESVHATDSLVECAKDTIGACESLLQQSVPLPALRSTFDFFLATSLAALFVAVASNPAKYGQLCAAYFHTALDLLSNSQSKFNTPREISCTLGSLRAAAERINMPSDPTGRRSPSAQGQIDREEWPQSSLEELFQFDPEVDLQILDRMLM
ncbi:hypothetical protein HFD88_005518 [Aspergillus terreus]|nr:hypothetical protein HFD88_005518 [Aspergillus terreus]